MNLETFLKRRRVITKFKKNIKAEGVIDPIDYIKKHSHDKNAIKAAFFWGIENNDEFWPNIHVKWLKQCQANG